VNASALIATTDHTIVSCLTDPNGPQAGSSRAQNTENPRPGEQIEDTLSVISVASLPNGGSITLHRAANSYNVPPPSDYATTTLGSFITATKVGTLNAQ
jgi:hypothetical protein